MIKFTIIFIIIYFVLVKFTTMYVNALSNIDKFRLSNDRYTTRERIWFALLGLMRAASIILGAISVILLVIKYL